MNKIQLIPAIISLFIIGCGNKTESSIGSVDTPIKVETLVIPESADGAFLTSSGIVEAANSASLSTRMMGFVDRIPVKTGDRVSKGTLLLSINNSDLSAKRAQADAAISEAAAALNNAETDYNRFKALFADNSASQKELDDMKARYEMARARHEAATQVKNEIASQFTYSNLRAPFSGVITGIFAEEGDMANPGVPLVTMEAPGTFEVNSRIAESNINRIKQGDSISVIVKAINTTVKATVSEVSPSSAKTGGQYLVKAVLDETPGGLRSGMYATLVFPVETAKGIETVTIPANAVVERGQLTGVYTLSQQETAILRWIRLGETLGDQVEVLSGLAPGETLILKGDGKLYNGVKVTVQ